MLPGPLPRERFQPVARQDGQVVEGVRSVQQGEPAHGLIEASARKVKQGPQVREGLLIEKVSFGYNVERYGETLEKLVQTTQFTVPAVVNGKRIPRTRARFDCPWSVVGVADVDEELVDKAKLTALAGAGRTQDWSGRLAAGEAGRSLRPVRRRGRDQAGRRRGGGGAPRRSRRSASAGKRGRAWRRGAA